LQSLRASVNVLRHLNDNVAGHRSALLIALAENRRLAAAVIVGPETRNLANHSNFDH
jgi:hypothetical protein